MRNIKGEMNLAYLIYLSYEMLELLELFILFPLHPNISPPLLLSHSLVLSNWSQKKTLMLHQK
jgi:hypothetical protein